MNEPMAIVRRDRCVSPGCDTPTNPADWPVVCRSCQPAIDEALDDYWTEHEPEMAELHHECVAEDAGYDIGSSQAPGDG